MIRALYEEACDTPSDIYGHLPRLRALAMESEKVIELGTRGGVSTIALLAGLELSEGHLWSVDIDPAPELEHERWTFIQGDDCSQEVCNQLPSNVDVVFIDTSHHYLHTLRELYIYSARVRPGGLILLHDTELARPEFSPRNDPLYPVKTAVEQFCTEEGFEWTNNPRCWGLGEIRIPE